MAGAVHDVGLSDFDFHQQVRTGGHESVVRELRFALLPRLDYVVLMGRAEICRVSEKESIALASRHVIYRLENS